MSPSTPPYRAPDLAPDQRPPRRTPVTLQGRLYQPPPPPGRQTKGRALRPLLLGLFFLVVIAVIGWRLVDVVVQHARTTIDAATVGRPLTIVAMPRETRVTPGGQQPRPTSLTRSRSDPTPVAPREPELRALELFMLGLINDDRAENGLGAVAWDDLAADVARGHAQAMANDDYMSHWDRQGHGPDHRYALAGGTEVVMENVYWFWLRYDDGTPAPIEDWQSAVRDAEMALMESPGHRANILHTDHTHVGVGIVYNTETGSLMVVQEFINRYLQIDQAPGETSGLREITLTGRVVADPGGELLVNLNYEPFPESLSVDELLHVMPHTYQSPAEFVLAQDVPRQGEAFAVTVPLDRPGAPGIYHVRIAFNRGEDDFVPASDYQVWLR